MTKRDEKILVSMLECATISEAATRAGVERKTIYNRLENPAFRNAYDRARNAAITTATGRLCGRLGSAIDIVQGIAQDADIAPQIRLNACQVLLSTAIRLNEQTNIQKQIDDLERRLKNENFN